MTSSFSSLICGRPVVFFCLFSPLFLFSAFFMFFSNLFFFFNDETIRPTKYLTRRDRHRDTTLSITLSSVFPVLFFFLHFCNVIYIYTSYCFSTSFFAFFSPSFWNDVVGR